MNFLYLMVKQHRITGKKYLCIKTAPDDKTAEKYRGSGLYWKRHYRKHGCEHVVHIKTLFKCTKDQKEKLKILALKYSLKLDVVNNPNWLNLVPEFGQGGAFVHGMKGKIFITNGKNNKGIKLCELPLYEAQGWRKGMSDTWCANNIASTRKYFQTHSHPTKGKNLVSITLYNIDTHEKKTQFAADWIKDGIHISGIYRGASSKRWCITDRPEGGSKITRSIAVKKVWDTPGHREKMRLACIAGWIERRKNNTVQKST